MEGMRGMNEELDVDDVAVAKREDRIQSQGDSRYLLLCSVREH
jgi:hypothetical protein